MNDLKCPYCNNTRKQYKRKSRYAKTCGSTACVSMMRKIANSSEVRLKISNSMKKCHSDGKHPGWTHINTREDRRSYPERFLLEVFRKNGILKKYTVLQQIPIHKYQLDFVVAEIKLNIEVDGSQHYRSPENIEHDRIRNEYLKSKGWRIYRINWSDMCKNTIGEIFELLKFIDDVDNKTDRYYEIDIMRGERVLLENKKALYEQEQISYIKKVLDSGIDFSKMGWVSKVAVIINKQPQKTGAWMKRFMPEFYDTKCFRTKRSKLSSE